MKLVITFLNGSREGEVIEFETSKERITFGRAADCDVVFPEDEDFVAPHHMALDRKFDGYEVDIAHDMYVSVDGKAIHEGHHLPKDCEIVLGGKKGPRLRVMFFPEHDHVRTRRQDKAPNAHRQSQRAGTLINYMSVIVLGVLLASVFAFYQANRNTVDIGRFSAETKDELETIANERISQAMRDRLRASVYLVVLRDQEGNETGLGTAWVAEGGTLVTNAHVADAYIQLRKRSEEWRKQREEEERKRREQEERNRNPFDFGITPGSTAAAGNPAGDVGAVGVSGSLDAQSAIPDVIPDFELLVRSPDGGPDAPSQEFEVIRIELHPGFNALQDDYLSFLPVTVNPVQNRGIELLRLIGGFDVALMSVKNPDGLTEGLQLASRETMVALSPGDPVAFAGYPMEGLAGSNAQPISPNPTSQVGTITSLTDFFNVRRADEDNLLIQHSMPLTGGASGSPMINSEGKVVGVVSAANFAFLNRTRIPLAVGVNFAQRADLALDLMDGSADERMPEYREEWRESLKLFRQGKDELPKLVVRDLKKRLGTDEEPELLINEEKQIGAFAPEYGKTARYWDINLEKRGYYVFMAFARVDKRIGMVVMRGGQVVKFQQGNNFPVVDVPVQDPGTYRIVVYGDDLEGEPFDFRLYYWTPEAAKMEQQQGGGLFSQRSLQQMQESAFNALQRGSHFVRCEMIAPAVGRPCRTEKPRPSHGGKRGL